MVAPLALSGRRFGKLKVVKRSPARRKRKMSFWICRCDCGRTTTVRGTVLLDGQKTCGRRCGLAQPKHVELSGKRFGRLLVIERGPKVVQGQKVKWLCKCECGRKVWAYGSNLRNGRTRSCGCLRDEGIDIAGRRFGRLVVIERSKKKSATNRLQIGPARIQKAKPLVYWHCKCDCGRATVTSGVFLRNGATRSCGCLLEEKLSAGLRSTKAVSPTESRPAPSAEKRGEGKPHAGDYGDVGLAARSADVIAEGVRRAFGNSAAPVLFQDFIPDKIDLRILNALHDSPTSLDLEGLAAWAEVARGTASKRVTVMIDAGLVERRSARGAMSLTPKGRALRAQIER